MDGSQMIKTASTDFPRKRDVRERLFSAVLGKMQVGDLSVTFPNGLVRNFHGSQVSPEPIEATLTLHSWKAVKKILSGGAIGLAEAYMDEDWSTHDLTTLLKLLAANMAVLEAKLPQVKLPRLLDRFKHWANRNNKSGSRKNISFHYDLGNDFYQLWLDESMTYSAAVFEQPGLTLADAQRAKYRRLAEAVGIKAGDHVLEIGCGWGGFAEYAAREFNCQVTGVTLSTEQKAFAEERIEKAGLSDNCAFHLRDYRDIEGQFDHIVSIEMLEAVGEAYWPTYFSKLKQLLKPGGRAGIQVITIEDERFASYRKNVDFIQKYIFPGGMLPSDKVFKAQAASVQLDLVDQFDFADGYEETLRRWHQQFNNVSDLVQAQGFDDRFMRMWRFYLSYCEAGFALGTIGVSHYVLR